MTLITAADIDEMLAERKRLVGAPEWREDARGSVAHLVIPVSRGVVVGGLSIRASAPIHEPVQTGSCVLVLDNRPVQRISFRPSHAHVNPFGPGVSAPLRGLRLPSGRSRLHPWAENRTWPRPAFDNVSVATPTLVELESFEMTLAIFLHMCAIDGEAPPPPWEPRLL